MAACYLELTLEQNEETEMVISFILLQGKIFHGKNAFFAWVGQKNVHIQNMILIYYQG